MYYQVALTCKASYLMPPFEFHELKNQLLEMCEWGFIQASDSPQEALVLLVWKKDGGIRMCADIACENAHNFGLEQPLVLPRS